MRLIALTGWGKDEDRSLLRRPGSIITSRNPWT
jgi:hypothetical protein